MTSPTFLAALAIVGAISTTTSAQTPFPMPDPVLVPPMLAAVQEPPPPPPAPAARSPQAPKPPATPGPVQPPKPPAPPPPPDSPNRQSVNIQVDVTIQSQGGTGTPISKTMTMLVADRRQTTLTAQASRGFRRLNGDVRANLLRDGKLEIGLNLDFDVSEIKEGVPPTQDQGGTAYRGVVNVVLENGKPQIISKSADPLTDRTVTVEVKATILK